MKTSPTKKPKKKQADPAVFINFCVQMGLPAPVAEYHFNADGFPDTKHRFDFAWTDCKLALEVDGGRFVGGRHNTAKGKEGDDRKMNIAACRGWRRIVRYPENLLTLATVQMVKEARCV